MNSAEFIRYLVEHPEFFVMLAAIRAAPPEHPVVYIEVGELAPVRSRLRNPRVLPFPAAYALA